MQIKSFFSPGAPFSPEIWSRSTHVSTEYIQKSLYIESEWKNEQVRMETEESPFYFMGLLQKKNKTKLTCGQQWKLLEKLYSESMDEVDIEFSLFWNTLISYEHWAT